MDVERLLRPIATPKTIRAFHRSLFRWYRRHGRDLPWRRTRDPYAVLVSEFMLQQTQVAAVIPYYERWLRRFPHFTALAAASENDVLHAWQGLGYYARAQNLHATAKIVQDRHHGIFPRDTDQLRRLPGVGKYTAHAVVSFAFDQPVPIVEANTARVLARLFDLRIPIDSAAGQKRLWQHAVELIPKHKAADFNSALLDLGALVCLPRQPKCGICPVERFCGAANPDVLPIKKARSEMKKLIENHALVIRRKKILLEQSRTRWRGMWILPPLDADCLKQSGPQGRVIHEAAFPFTNHRIRLRVFARNCAKIDNRSQRWFSVRALDSIPIPSPHRRAIVDLVSVKRATAKRRPQS